MKMKSSFFGVLIALIVLGFAPLGLVPASAQSPAVGATKHGTFTVELVKALDSRKLKPGHAVEAELTGGITLHDGSEVPREAKVIGHVTEAQARSKNGTESALGIVFDKIVRPDRVDTSINGVVLAAAPNPNPPVTTGTMSDAYANDLAARGERPVLKGHGFSRAVKLAISTGL